MNPVTYWKYYKINKEISSMDDLEKDVNELTSIKYEYLTTDFSDYFKCRNISIDYAFIEKFDTFKVVKCNFLWDVKLMRIEFLL